MTYALSAAPLTMAQANRDMGWTKARQKAYWDARARGCQNTADEGACLAQVARHVPVTIAGCDGLVGCDGIGGLGVDIASAIDTAAALLRDPNAYLRTHGPALVTSLDTYVVGPLIGTVARKSLPYALKYVVPPIAILYLLSGLSLYYSHAAYARGAGKVTANRRRRRKRR